MTNTAYNPKHDASRYNPACQARAANLGAASGRALQLAMIIYDQVLRAKGDHKTALRHAREFTNLYHHLARDARNV